MSNETVRSFEILALHCFSPSKRTFMLTTSRVHLSIKDRTGAQIVYGGAAKGVVDGADRFLFEGEALPVGDTCTQGLATPGHTNCCTSYVVPGAVFTGDYRSSVVMAGRTCKVARQRCYSIPYARSFLVFQTTPSFIPVMITKVGRCHRRSRRKSNGTKGSTCRYPKQRLLKQ